MSLSRYFITLSVVALSFIQTNAQAMSESCKYVFNSLHGLDLGYSGQVPAFNETVKVFEQQVARNPSLKDCRDDYGTTAIGAALTNVQMCPLLFVAERLIDMGFKVDEPDRFERTPLEGAAEWHARLFLELKDHTAMVAPYCFKGFAPPTREVSESVLKGLIASGARTNRVSRFNQTIEKDYEFYGLSWAETLENLK